MLKGIPTQQLTAITAAMAVLPFSSHSTGALIRPIFMKRSLIRPLDTSNMFLPSIAVTDIGIMYPTRIRPRTGPASVNFLEKNMAKIKPIVNWNTRQPIVNTNVFLNTSRNVSSWNSLTKLPKPTNTSVPALKVLTFTSRNARTTL